MWPALPASDYYEGSVPSRGHRPTAGLPATDPDGRWGGRRRDGSHVHHAPIDGGDAELCPCTIATGTPQSFSVASWPGTLALASESPACGRALPPGPYPPGLS